MRLQVLLGPEESTLRWEKVGRHLSGRVETSHVTAPTQWLAHGQTSNVTIMPV